MGEEEVVITYESLYELLRREKYRPELQKLEPVFYANALNYLKEKQAILDAQEKRNSIFAANEIEKTRTQLRNIQKILKEIYEKREAKILQLALFNSRNKAAVHDDSTLLPEEGSLFDSVSEVLNIYREGVLFNLLSNNAPSVPLKKEKDLKITSEIDKDKPDSGESKVKVRILAAIPEFVGPDMNVYGPFEGESSVELPKEISEVLIANNQAEAQK